MRDGTRLSRTCDLIKALMDGPKTLTGLVEWMGVSPRVGETTLREWLREFEASGLVRRTEQDRPMAMRNRAAVYEWISE